jgi:hypothetical protein
MRKNILNQLYSIILMALSNNYSKPISVKKKQIAENHAIRPGPPRPKNIELKKPNLARDFKEGKNHVPNALYSSGRRRT